MSIGKSTFLKIPFPSSFPICLGLKTKEEPRTNQGRTKDEPKNPKTQKVLFVKIAISYTLPNSTERRPREDREKSSRNILQNFAFFHSPPCTFQKKVVSLPSKVQRRGLEGGICPISESQMLTQRPQSWLSRHIKKAFIALCSDNLKSRKFQPIRT